ncbi:ABC transporter ATP-binding protein [Streptomyces sp. NPDC086989]|uniref:ABC transporter ATP-binding protein n=1 Tax=Streptomyces sp. NPDC086989 TaxID=3365764 RepID=UPI00381D6EB3
MPEQPVIEVSDLHQKYGEFAAVRGISFDVQPGEVFALLGTNGAGKTTTMDVLEGFRPATRGTARVLGVDPHAHRRKIAHRVGIMLQEAGFFQELTAAQTVDAWRRFMVRARSRTEALAMVRLEDRANTPVGRMSGGEKRRLDLALALLGRPEVLFLDEPTTGLDPEARRDTWKLIKGLVGEGMTVLLTTHYMEEAEFLADRVAIMDHGRIVRSGTLGEMVQQFAARISFRLPAGLRAADLPVLSGTEVQEESGRTVLLARDPQDVLRALLHWADGADASLRELEVRSASLEDVFLDVAENGRKAP